MLVETAKFVVSYRIKHLNKMNKTKEKWLIKVSCLFRDM